MDSIENVHTNIKTYIRKTHNINPDENISLSLTRLNSLSNDIYHVIITNTSTNEIIEELAYRNFGEIGDIVNRPLEESVISSLADNGLGPRILSTDHKTYRMEEFLQNSLPVPHNTLKHEQTLQQMIPTILAYGEIAPVYAYTYVKESKSISITKFNEHIERPVNTNQNIYELCMKDMLKKGLNHLEKFINHSRISDTIPNDSCFFKKLDKIAEFAEKLNDTWDTSFPKKGFFILNHNDTLSLNLLMKDDKILLIDHEYGALNLIGFDVVNYLVESNFNYVPYEFTQDEIDLKLYHNIYLQYIDAFEKSEKHSHFCNDDIGKEELKHLKSFKYFKDLLILDNILWFIFALIYFDYEKYTKEIGFNYFQHAYDRTVYYQTIIDYINSNPSI